MQISPAASTASPTMMENAVVANQRWIIVFLVVILFFSLLGAEGFNIIGSILSNLVQLITKLVVYISANLGYSTGSLINSSSNIASNAAISSLEVADGAINSVGNIFRDSAEKNITPEIKKTMDKIVDESEDFLLLPRKEENKPQVISSAGAAAASGGGEDSLRRDLDEVINRMNRIEKNTVNEDKTNGIIQQRAAGGTNAGNIGGGSVNVDKNAWCLVGSLGGKRSCISVKSGDTCGYARLYDDKLSCIEKTA